MSSEITSSTARNCWWRSTAPRTLGDSHGFINRSVMSSFASVVCSSVRCMDDWIVHSSLSSTDDVHGWLHRGLWTSSTDDLTIVQGGPRQPYTLFLVLENCLLSTIPVTIYFWSWTTLMDELETDKFSILSIIISFILYIKKIVVEIFITKLIKGDCNWKIGWVIFW